MRATVPTEAKAVINLVRGAGPHVRVALEEGTQAQWLHDLIAPIAEARTPSPGRSELIANAKTKKTISKGEDRRDNLSHRPLNSTASLPRQARRIAEAPGRTAFGFI